MLWLNLLLVLVPAETFQGLFHPKMVTQDQCIGWSVENRLLACLVGYERSEEDFERGVAIMEVDGKHRRVRFYSFARRISPWGINAYLDKHKFAAASRVAPVQGEYRLGSWVLKVETGGTNVRILSREAGQDQLVEKYSTQVEQGLSVFVEGVYYQATLAKAAVLIALESEGCAKGCRSFVQILDVPQSAPASLP